MWFSSAAGFSLLSIFIPSSFAAVIRATHRNRPVSSGRPISASYVSSSSTSTSGSGITLNQTPDQVIPPSSNVVSVLISPPTAQWTFFPAFPLTLNHPDFLVSIDTGSSDLWVVSTPDFQFDTTGSQPATITYGSGSVAGTTGFATVQLGDYTFSSQAFLNVSEIQGNVADPGVEGLIGLSFSGAAHTAVENALGPDVGQPFLFNIFDQTPDQDNFIGIALSRTDDLDTRTLHDTADTTPHRYMRIRFRRSDGAGHSSSTASMLMVWVSPSRARSLGRPTEAHRLEPPTRHLLRAVLQYSRCSRWFHGTGDDFAFSIPCNTTSIVTVVIGGIKYPIHPLDLSLITNGRMIAATMSQFNFGDAVAKSPTNNSSMQVLSLTDPQSAIADVLNVRMAQFASRPPEVQGISSGLTPALPGSTRNSTLATLPQPGSNSSSTSSSGSSSGHGAGSSSDALAKNLASTSGDGTSTTTSDPVLRKYALIIIGLLGGNLLLVIVLVVIGSGCALRKAHRG
ncbi:hypothetical protein B0H13DRAFT_1928093 [Mycena leptocephala]|nr:hypothetical protein B0H13DRAFT_1928093 [Mycena leptocephala]